MSETTRNFAQYACGWCAVFNEHLPELMQAALFFAGSVERVEAIVLEALDVAIAQRDVDASRTAARRFVMRTALRVTWRALRPQVEILPVEAPVSVLAAA